MGVNVSSGRGWAGRDGRTGAGTLVDDDDGGGGEGESGYGMTRQWMSDGEDGRDAVAVQWQAWTLLCDEGQRTHARPAQYFRQVVGVVGKAIMQFGNSKVFSLVTLPG